MRYSSLSRHSVLAASLSVLLVSCGPPPTEPLNKTGVVPPQTVVPSTNLTAPPLGFSADSFLGFSEADAQTIANSFDMTGLAVLDLDKDGELNEAELDAYLDTMPVFFFDADNFATQAITLSSKKAVLQKYDKNSNGKLDKNELLALLKDLLQKNVTFKFKTSQNSAGCLSNLAPFLSNDKRFDEQKLLDYFRTKVKITLGAADFRKAFKNYQQLVKANASEICGSATPGTPSTTTSPSPSSSAPTASPSPSPSASVSASPSTSASPSASASASASASSANTNAGTDISTVETTTFNGKVYDDTNGPLDGVKITARSLSDSSKYVAETSTTGGAYAFNDAPSGIQVEIVARKAGFTTRKRVEVLKSNKQGDPNANKYDFGFDGSAGGSGNINNALSDKPEVIAVTPARNGSGVDPRTSLVLKFSESMDRKTVEDTFTVRAYNSRKLSVDNGKTSFNSFSGDSQISTITNNLIWNKDTFNISWNSDDTEATLAFKNETLLPTDKDSDKVPDYQVAFNDTIGSAGTLLKDKSGISRSNNHFKLTEGPFEQTFKFAIKTDETKPLPKGLNAQTDENQGVNGDAVKVEFSERMIIYTKTRTIAGGGEDVDSGSAQKAPAGYPGATNVTNRETAKNYTVSITPAGTTSTTYTGTWFALGGEAVYDSEDPTHKTVILLPPRHTVGAATTYPNGVYLNTMPATTTAITGAIAVVAGDEYSLDVDFVKPDGTKVPTVVVANDIANDTRDASSTATALQTELNRQAAGATGLSSNPFTVTASSDSKSLIITMKDTTFTYIGWTVASIVRSAGATVPGSLPTGRSFVSQKFLNVYNPGDTIRVVVSSTVLDPAGNTIDSSRDNVSGNAS